MKKGDIVKHPMGMVNVNEKLYASGIVLDVIHPTNPPGEQCLVMWVGLIGPMQYLSDHLEVVSEAR